MKLNIHRYTSTEDGETSLQVAFISPRGSTTLENRVTEFVDRLHEFFIDPVRVDNDHYMLPDKAGYSAEIYPATLRDYNYPNGHVWSETLSTK